MTGLRGVEVRPFGGGIVSGAAHAATRAISSRRGALVEVRGEDGRVGLGEASPLGGFHVETVDDVVRSIREVAPRLRSLGIRDGESFEYAVRDERIQCMPPSARFGLETALLDWAAKGIEAPACRLLGGPACRDSCLVSTYCGSLLADDAAEAGAQSVADGYLALKWKTPGDDIDGEAVALERIRARLPAVEIRVDWNGARSLQDAREALAVYARFDVGFVEEPCAMEALLELGPQATRWFADESMSDPSVASALIARSSCAGVVLKPARMGIFGARRLALEAIAAGKAVVVTHMFDGPVALLAARAVALSLPIDPIASALGEHAALKAYRDIGLPELARTKSGRAVNVSSKPGLGYRFEEPWTS